LIRNQQEGVRFQIFCALRGSITLTCPCFEEHLQC
jgi:hypothetical protein